MSSPTEEIKFSYKEIVEMLVKKEGIHKGLWGIYVGFHLHGANVTLGDKEPLPASVVQITQIGIKPVKKLDYLSVDAAEVNPAPSEAKKASKKGGAAKK